MQDHPEVPKLPKLPFIASDVFLLCVAGFIAYQAPSPLEGGALIAIVICVVVGAILLGIPFIAEYGRRTDVLLRERQDEIAALAKTTSACVEQVSIATASLHSLAESHARSVRTLEALPQKLQEKVAEFKSQLNEISVAENEALEQELQTLRAAESERLQSAVDELAKLSREFARIEAAASQISNTLLQLGEQSAAKVANSFTQAAHGATQEIESSLARARLQLVDEAKEAQARAVSTWSSRTSESFRELEGRFEALARRLTSQIDSSGTGGTVNAPAAKPTAVPVPAPTAAPTPKAAPSLSAPAAAVPVVTPAITASGSGASTPPTEPRAPAAPAPAAKVATPPSASTPELSLSERSTPPSAPASTTTTSLAATAAPAPSVPPVASSITAPSSPAQPTAASPVRRAVERGSTAPVEAALSSDGATRLLVTAYIGIGNKLFARGSGPGLSWEKGVALHFVSIGKWRWDTPDATGPVQIKLFKNDQVECTAVGTLELEPGHQHEVTATF